MEEGKLGAMTQGVAGANHSFYEALWSRTRLTRPESFNTWPVIAPLLSHAAHRLEIGPGLRPRLPISGTHFIDISATVIDRLNALGGEGELGDATLLPFAEASMDLVCAFDVIEHVEDHLRAFQELGRVLKDDGFLILSVPLYPGLWTAFDDFVGHVRRYRPEELTSILERCHLVPVRSSVFGMQPASPRLLDLGIWLLTHQRSISLFWYNWVFLPLRLSFQGPLRFTPGVPEGPSISEIVVLCRRCNRGGAPPSAD